MFCEYCNTQFKSTSSLNFHQKSAKYCLKIQNKNEIIEEKDKNEQCQICMKVFTKKYIFTHIQNSCITNINSFIKDLKNESNDLRNKLNEKELELQKKEREIIELKSITNILKNDHDCLKDIARQPKNITNNNKILNIVTPLNLTNTDQLKTIIDTKYKLDYIFSGQKGIAKFAIDHILKDEEGNPKYVCTDPSRQIFKYKDESGEVRKDVEAKKLTNFLVEGGIRDKACDIMNEWWTEETGITNVDKFELLVDKAESLKAIDSDNTEFKKELATMTTI
jgi:hypothetical protein